MVCWLTAGHMRNMKYIKSKLHLVLKERSEGLQNDLLEAEVVFYLEGFFTHN